MTYAADHGGTCPATEYVTYTPNDRTADNLGNKYLDTWPRNPWTGEPMANTGSTSSSTPTLTASPASPSCRASGPS